MATFVLAEQIVYHQLPENNNAVWSLLLASGYLKVASTEYVKRTEGWNYKLTLTNCETKVMFENMAIDVNHKDDDRHTSDLDSLF